MAGEATHALLADQTCDQVLHSFPKQEFILGTLFPDIRYLGVVDRTATHEHGLTLAMIAQSPNPFAAGARFHGLVDDVRNKFMNASGIYDHCPPFLFDQQSLKLLEDELFYSLFGDWSRIVYYLRRLERGPEQFGVSLDAARQWYALMADYLSVQPCDASRTQVLEALGFTSESSILINAYIDELKKNKKVTAIMYDFYKRFSMLI